MSSGGRLTVLLCAGTLLLTACGGDGSRFADLFGEAGAPGAPPPEGEQAPYVPDYPVAEYEKENIPIFQNLRQIDPCAMFDLEAIKKVAGSPDLDSIVPGDPLGECTVNAGTSELKRTWSFKITVGDTAGTEPPEPIGDMQFQKYAPRASGCRYTNPVSKSHGVSLQTQWNGDNREQPPTPACDVAKQYLTDTIARWKTPPKRTENKSTPALLLGTIDPCMSAKTLLNGAEGRAKLSGPNRCTVAPKAAPTKDKTAPTPEIGIAFEFSSDPAQQPANNPTSFKPAQIKGKPASVFQSGSRCIVTVQYSADTMLKLDENKNSEMDSTQVVEVTASTCEAASAAAETVVGRVLEVKLPKAQPAQGAVKLGDLNPPKSWQEVGAPADPCAVVGWDAFPAEARNPKGTKPTRKAPEKDTVFKAACRFEAGGTEITLDKDKPASQSTKIMLALIVWGDDASGMSIDPAKQQGATPKDYGGKAGIESSFTDSLGNPSCLGVFKTADKGYWGLSVTNGAFPNVPACAISSSVLNAIAAKM